MANKMSEKSEKQLSKDVSKILKLASRKKGATGSDICKALGVRKDFTTYRYRRAMSAAKLLGIKLHGAGALSVWKCKPRKKKVRK